MRQSVIPFPVLFTSVYRNICVIKLQSVRCASRLHSLLLGKLHQSVLEEVTSGSVGLVLESLQQSVLVQCWRIYNRRCWFSVREAATVGVSEAATESDKESCTY